jgi:uncharacterized protein YbjT (DUF2867 family)
MTGHGAKFGRKKEEAIAALLVHRNTEEAARAAGIAQKTLLRWLQIPEFQAAFRAAKWAAYSQTIGRLHQMSAAAVSTLGKVMVDPSTPPAVKVRAADSILNHTGKAIETENLEARLSELERAEASRKK